MNARTTAGLLVLVSLVCLATGCNGQKPITFKLSPETNAQTQRVPELDVPAPHLSAAPSRWEYKVVKTPGDGEQELTKFLNELGRDGWEFAGQLQTKASYLVLRRPKLPRDYIRSRGDLMPPDLPGDLATGRLGPSTAPSPRTTAPSTARIPPPPKKDTRPTGLQRPGEKPGD